MIIDIDKYRKSRYNLPNLNLPMEGSLMNLSKSYVAGFFDAEGCVSILIAKNEYVSLKTGAVRKYERPSLTVQISNTCLEVLQAIQAMYGGNLYNQPKPSSTHRQCHVLRFNGVKSREFLTDMKKLCVVKTKQIQLGLEFLSIERSNRNHDRRMDIARQIRELNGYNWNKYRKAQDMAGHQFTISLAKSS